MTGIGDVATHVTALMSAVRPAAIRMLATLAVILAAKVAYALRGTAGR